MSSELSSARVPVTVDRTVDVPHEAGDLLIVAAPDDPVAVEMRDYLAEHSRRAVVLDPFDAAQLFTVSVRNGMACVEPEVPLFLRLPAPPSPRPSFDAEFHYHECLAQLWATAALMREQWWVQDSGTMATAAWPQRPPGGGPFRARWSDVDPAFEVVVVLDDHAWRCTTAELARLRLRERSIALAAELGLTLAALTWRIDAGGTVGRLVNVEPFPGLELLRMVWFGLGPHLLTVLFP
ncbi:MAG: hypothetical protein ACRDRI_16975 [Pseudonocardiaceae bacterium]